MANYQLKQLATEMPLGEFYKRYLLRLNVSRFSKATRQCYKSGVWRFINNGAPKHASQVTAEHIDHHIFELQKSLSARSCNLHLCGLRDFFKWLVRSGEIPSNPALNVDRLKTLPPRRRNLKVEEYQKLMKSTKGYMRDCIQFLCMTGIRASEFLNLRPENVRGDFLVFIGKGGKQCTVPLNSTAKSILKSNPSMNFIKSKDRTWLWRTCRRAAKRANIEPFNPHALRHFYANALRREAKLSIEEISKLMNHSSPTITARVYQEWSNDELIGKTEKLADLM